MHGTWKLWEMLVLLPLVLSDSRKGHADYFCSSIHAYCLENLTHPCELGTVCDENFHRTYPGDSPCVEPAPGPVPSPTPGLQRVCDSANNAFEKGTYSDNLSKAGLLLHQVVHT